jgi:periplasmic protein TonB
MLDQLVESKSHSSENAKRSGFLLTTFVIVTAVFLGGLVYSLFAKELGTSDEGLELTTLVAPPLPEEAPPPPPEPETKPEKQTVTKETDVTIVKEAFASIDQTRTPPEDTKGRADVMPVRAGEKFKIGDVNQRAAAPSTGVERGTGGGTGIASGPPQQIQDEEEPPPPVKKETPKPTPPPVPKVISKGVINGSAISLPKPPYPPAAKAVRAAGTVSVQVTIDENGNVISASAAGGHPLLQQAAVSAARQAKFKPTLLSGVPVKVTGIITYNFVAQ